ncbi:hypothetical protein JCM11641_004221 [Rhodosporidiobolus odoratus]
MAQSASTWVSSHASVFETDRGDELVEAPAGFALRDSGPRRPDEPFSSDFATLPPALVLACCLFLASSALLARMLFGPPGDPPDNAPPDRLSWSRSPQDGAVKPPRSLAETAAVLTTDSAPLPGPSSAALEPIDGVDSSAPQTSASRHASSNDKAAAEPARERVVGGTRDFGFLPIPKRLQYDSERPFNFGLLLNALFGFAATFTVANLYYPQPILIVLSQKFDVSYDEVTNIPTFLQASYALGLAFICPCGDLVRRRPMLLILVACSAILSLVLALVPSVAAFQAVSFFLGASSVTPQILLPLSGDLAPPERRGSALSIVLSGLLLGILIARVLAGLIAEKASVSALYYMSFGLQALIWVMVYAMVPDYPAKNKHLSYFEILWSMVKYLCTEPVLIQGALISGVASIVFSCFWTTSTFLLGDIFGYNSLEIGLFGLVGVLGVVAAPFLGRLVDNLVSWVGVFFGLALLAVSQAIFTGAAGVNVGALAVVIFLLDIGMQLQQVANSTRIFAINAAARARLSACFLVAIFAGQLIGTSAGTRVYLRWGYKASGGLCLGLVGFILLVLFLRGPHCPTTRWVGWTGGWELRKKVAEKKQTEKAGEVEKQREANGV